MMIEQHDRCNPTPLRSAHPEVLAGSQNPFVSLRVRLGIEDALAFLKSSLLVAAYLRTTVCLRVAASAAGNPVESQIHFGPSPCHWLFLGLLETVERRLGDASSGNERRLTVEIEIVPNLYPIMISLRALPESESCACTGSHRAP